MGDRFYTQIKEAKGFKSVAETMAFCHKAYRPNENRTKPEIAAEIGISGVDALVKEELLWLEEHLFDLDIDLGGISITVKKQVVSVFTKEYPNISWNKLTLKTLLEVANAKVK